MKTSKKSTQKTFATKAEMIATLIAQGVEKFSEIRKQVMEVFTTCYYSEITRVQTKLMKDAAAA